jgi:hypothetical protein
MTYMYLWRLPKLGMPCRKIPCRKIPGSFFQEAVRDLRGQKFCVILYKGAGRRNGRPIRGASGCRINPNII